MDRDDDRRRGDGFLAAWSRRKRAALRADAAAKKPAPETVEGEGGTAGVEDAADPAAMGEAASGQPADEITQEELSALPSIADISGDTDLGPFFKRGVPGALRKAAMRKVWLSKLAILNHDDPAVDYAWDWNGPGGVPGAGGTIGRDRVAKMIDDLINKERRAPDSQAAADPLPADDARMAGDEEAAAVASERPDGAPEAVAPARPETEYPSDPRRLSDGNSSGRTQEAVGDAAEPKAPAAPERPAGRVRSHGGAMPT